MGFLIFLIPSNLFSVLNRELGYFGGLRVDYLIPKLYLNELVAATFIVIALFLRIASFKVHWKVVVFISSLAIIQVFSLVPLSSLWFLLELMLITLLVATMWQLPRIVTNSKFITYSLGLTIIFQSTLAIYQFIFQHSFGGYWLLGQSNLLQYAGIANQTLLGAQYILPSGTTPHPNILAGILVGLMTLVWLRRNQLNKLFLATILTLGAIAIILTFSISAWISASAVTLVFYEKKYWQKTTKTRITRALWFLFLLTPTLLILAQLVSTNPSVERRVALNKEATKMLIYHPLTGVGLNNFVPSLISTTDDSSLIQFAQPTHHVGLLILSEIGLIGIIGLFVLLQEKKPLFKQDSLLFFTALFVPLLSLDHYIYTLPEGRLLLGLCLAMMLRKN